MMKSIDLKFAVLMFDVMSGQSKGCWADIQFGYCRLLLKNLWPRAHHSGAWLHLFVFGPAHDPLIGYRLRHIGLWISHPFGRRLLKLDFMTGDGYGNAKWRQWFPVF